MKTEHFKGIDDAGNTYQVVSYSREIHHGPPPVYGIPEFRLANGASLSPVEDGNRKFVVVQTGAVITLV